VPLALFIVGYGQIVRFVGAASDDARVRISLAAAQAPLKQAIDLVSTGTLQAKRADTSGRLSPQRAAVA
jgi:hypothetical protein